MNIKQTQQANKDPMISRHFKSQLTENTPGENSSPRESLADSVRDLHAIAFLREIKNFF